MFLTASAERRNPLLAAINMAWGVFLSKGRLAIGAFFFVGMNIIFSVLKVASSVISNL
jgi:hypothetical protein